jgi:hypothetical protein
VRGHPRLTQINREIAARFIRYSVRIASTYMTKTRLNPCSATRDFVSEPSRLRRRFGQSHDSFGADNAKYRRVRPRKAASHCWGCEEIRAGDRLEQLRATYAALSTPDASRPLGDGLTRQVHKEPK